MKWLNTVLPAAALGFMVLGFASTPAFATTSTTTLAVTTSVVSNCTISTTPMSFGNYTGAVNNSTSTFTIQCSNSSGYSVGLDKGTTSGGTVTARLMTDGTNTLNYRLCSDGTSCATIWGNTSGSWVTGTGTGSTQTLTVYGQIPASQFVPVGDYADSVVATITY
jgi:spore coat protein U-like protein